ncbi:hypothetical protein CEK28_09280 [Xenophilus sp. AP218F]|nr:DUF2164 domain-containing protein [Chromobacterium sp. ASV5]OWY39069.1 hypothetical protein CEK28_09280 [Xenophilus sp. AP218F]
MAAQALLSQQQLQSLTPALQTYLRDQLGVEVGGFDAQFLLEFVAGQLGREIYNRALADAQAALSVRMEALQAAIWELEK